MFIVSTTGAVSAMNWTKYYCDQAGLAPGRSFPFERHYKTQIGGGGFYSGVKYQQGYGLGGLFSKLGRFVIPLLKPVAKSIGKQVVRSGTQLADDILNGQNPKQAFKKNLKQGAKELFHQAIKKPAKRANKRKKSNKSGVISKKRRTRKLDIFD